MQRAGQQETGDDSLDVESVLGTGTIHEWYNSTCSTLVLLLEQVAGQP